MSRKPIRDPDPNLLPMGDDIGQVKDIHGLGYYNEGEMPMFARTPLALGVLIATGIMAATVAAGFSFATAGLLAGAGLTLWGLAGVFTGPAIGRDGGFYSNMALAMLGVSVAVSCAQIDRIAVFEAGLALGEFAEAGKFMLERAADWAGQEIPRFFAWAGGEATKLGDGALNLAGQAGDMINGPRANAEAVSAAEAPPINFSTPDSTDHVDLLPAAYLTPANLDIAGTLAAPEASSGGVGGGGGFEITSFAVTGNAPNSTPIDLDACGYTDLGYDPQKPIGEAIKTAELAKACAALHR